MQRILLLILIGLRIQSVVAQDTTLTRGELRVMASESFAKSDFTSASIYYKRLLDYYPKDPTYHYYLGACKEEVGEELQESVQLLVFASTRYSPPDVYYYLGAAYQKQGDFANALVAYQQYSDRASRKDISQRQVEARIKECKSGQKLITRQLPVKMVNAATDKSDSTKTGTILKEPLSTDLPKIEKDKQVVFPPRNNADESGYMELLNEALRIQMKSDSLVREADRLRREMAGSNDWTSKKKTLAEINMLQTESDNLQNSANAIYSKARGLELKFVHGSLQNKTLRTDSLGNSHQKSEKQITVKTENAKNNTSANDIDTIKTVYKFAILGQSPYSATNPIPIDTVVHIGICYKIQVGVFSKPVDFQQFRGLSPINAEKIIESGFTRYYAGLFNHINETELVLEKVRNYGFKEAFIVSFYNGKKISLIRAREIEQMLKTN